MAARSNPYSTINQVRDVFPSCAATSGALENGVTREEIGEVITHLAFYAGWPNAGTAALLAKQVFEERD